MEVTRVLYTEMEAGMNYLPEKCSYLRQEFFDNNPTEKPDDKDDGREDDDDDQGEAQAKIEPDDDSFIRASSQDKEAQRRSVTEKDEDDDDKSLQQVDINMLQVDWLTSTFSGVTLLETMATSNDCQKLF